VRARPDWPFAPRRWPFFYGWVVAAGAAWGFIASIPGQTMGVSVYTDHLIAATGLDRFDLSNAYLVGTLISGLVIPFAGPWVDRLGCRTAGIAAALIQGVTLFALAALPWLLAPFAGGASAWSVAFVLLAVGFAFLRFSGQGMLTLVSRTMIGKWFERRRGLVSGVVSLFVAFSFASAPLFLQLGIEALGWRGSWVLLGLVAGLATAALAAVVFRDNPEECGLRMDGVAPDAPPGSEDRPGFREFTRGEALRTAAFWIPVLGLSFHGLIITGLTFHIVALGREHGLVTREAVAIFLPGAAVSTSTGFLVGLIADRVRLAWLVAALAVFQALCLVGFAFWEHPWMQMLLILGWGAGAGCWGPLSTIALPRFFGRRHLGAIGGVLMSSLVIASALGPSFMAGIERAVGSFTPSLMGMLVLPALLLLAAPFVRTPQAVPEVITE